MVFLWFIASLGSVRTPKTTAPSERHRSRRPGERAFDKGGAGEARTVGGFKPRTISVEMDISMYIYIYIPYVLDYVYIYIHNLICIYKYIYVYINSNVNICNILIDTSSIA